MCSAFNLLIIDPVFYLALNGGAYFEVFSVSRWRMRAL